MARIVYALSGQGRGHTSRVLAVSDALRSRGHEIVFCCGGTAREILESREEPVIPVPALRQVMVDNQIRHFKTFRANAYHVLSLPRIVSALSRRFEAVEPDLLITDFEAFSPRAARRVGIPVLSFNHQQVVTELEYDYPPRYARTATMTASVIRIIAPTDPAHILLTSFFFGPLKHPEHTSLIPPIIRPEVQVLTPREGEHVLVYYNQTDGAEHVLEALSRIDARFILYNFPAPPERERYPNLIFKKPSIEEFAHDLASCRAVICTAGFTLISESLYLGKPLLVVPNRGIFEQTINAIFLEKHGLGSAVIERPLNADDVQQFISNIDSYRARMTQHGVLGNSKAVEIIEELLARKAQRTGGNSTSSARERNGVATGPYVAKAE